MNIESLKYICMYHDTNKCICIIGDICISNDCVCVCVCIQIYIFIQLTLEQQGC